MYFPGAGTMDMTFQHDGSIVLERLGKRHTIQGDPGDEPPMGFANIHGWLILSHFAARPIVVDEEVELPARVDPMILLEVGACPIVLRAVGPDLEMNVVASHHTPDGDFVCERAGIVEPITLSIFKYLGATRSQAEDWIEEAVDRNSLPLLVRIHIALEELISSAHPETKAFARRMLKDHVNPVMAKFPTFH
jgi:hypothetical protein